MRTAIAHQNDTLDAVCWRELGKTRTVVELVAELNPQLLESPFLKAGDVVMLPESQISVSTSWSGLNLWD